MNARVIAAILVVLALVGGGLAFVSSQSGSKPQASPVVLVTASPTPAPTATPTPEPTVTPTPVPTATPRPSTPDQIIAASVKAASAFSSVTLNKKEQNSPPSSATINARYNEGNFGYAFSDTYSGQYTLKPEETCGSAKCWVLYAEWTDKASQSYKLSVYVDQTSMLVVRRYFVINVPQFGSGWFDWTYTDYR
ncbi:hypothetical protein KGQ71_03635 [Patescibacteria group bacterium]|nr:hypothetical protein [Patescibacteria group bacterium]